MFSLEVLEKDYDLGTPEGKTAFFQEAARRLGRFEEEIERNNYIEAVAEKYHTGFEELRKLVTKMAVREGLRRPAERPKTAGGREKEDGIRKSQKILLTWLVSDERVSADQRLYFPGRFFGRCVPQAAELLFAQYQEGM